jgi:hypothetical protein
MKGKVLAIGIACFLSSNVFASGGGTTCHARAVEAVELKAIADGHIQSERLYGYEVSVRRSGFNLYTVTLAADDTAPKLIYSAFSNYYEQGHGAEPTVDCKINSIFIDAL